MLDYVGSPITVRGMDTGLTMDGKIISIKDCETQSEIMFSADGSKFTIVRDNDTGHWYENQTVNVIKFKLLPTTAQPVISPDIF